MPISATGRTRRRRAAGFSLIELMVVLVLIGLAAGVAVMTLPEGGDSLEDDAEAFAGLVGRAGQASIVSGDMLGIRLTAAGYEILRYRRGIWSPATDGRALRDGSWPDDTYVALAGEAKGTPARERERSEDGAGQRAPDIRFDPIGMVTPFEIIFERGTEEITVTGDAAGTVKIETR